jgi:hypothetical protein
VNCEVSKKELDVTLCETVGVGVADTVEVSITVSDPVHPETRTMANSDAITTIDNTILDFILVPTFKNNFIKYSIS